MFNKSDSIISYQLLSTVQHLLKSRLFRIKSHFKKREWRSLKVLLLVPNKGRLGLSEELLNDHMCNKLLWSGMLLYFDFSLYPAIWELTSNFIYLQIWLKHLVVQVLYGKFFKFLAGENFLTMISINYHEPSAYL